MQVGLLVTKMRKQFVSLFFSLSPRKWGIFLNNLQSKAFLKKFDEIN